MKKLKLKNIIFYISVFVMFTEIMLIQVHAAELELEPKTDSESKPFELKISYSWTSKGQMIKYYDVSENGQIAITFDNDTICVFDNDMNFLYQISYVSNGSSGAVWMDEKLLFIEHRSNTAAVCGSDGLSEDFYEITGPRNYYSEIVEKRIREQGNYRYFCTNGSGGNNPLVHWDYYTILKRTSREGEEEFSMKKCRNF